MKLLKYLNNYRNGQHTLPKKVPLTNSRKCQHWSCSIIFCSTGERLNISHADLQALALRYQKWVAREDKKTDFELFFSELNKASGVGVVILREIVALLMFSEAALKEVHRRRSEDIGARLFPLLPMTLFFRAEGGKPE